MMKNEYHILQITRKVSTIFCEIKECENIKNKVIWIV